MRIALVGYGQWGANIARCLNSLGVLDAVCDSDVRKQVEVISRYPAAHVYDCLEMALKEREIDGVVVATPAATHHAVALEVLAAGVDVLVEKPMCLEVFHGQELVDMAAAQGRVLLVGHVVEYHPAFVKLKQMVDAGELGRIQYIYSNRLNWGKFRTEENILWSFAPHDIALILSLTGKMPATACCHGVSRITPPIADVTLSTLCFDDGPMAHVFVSWLNPFKEQKLVVVGDRAMGVFSDTEMEKLKIYRGQVLWDHGQPVAHLCNSESIKAPLGEPLMLECQDFLECIQTRHQPRVDGVKGLNVLKVLEMCQESLDKEGTFGMA